MTQQIANADFSHILKDCQFCGDPSCIGNQTGLISKALQDTLSSEGHLPNSNADTPSTNFWTAAQTSSCDGINTLPAPACVTIRPKVDGKERKPDQQLVRPTSETQKTQRVT